MFGQIPDFSNSFDLLRRMWSSGSGMPSGLMPGLSAMTPPMDLDEVDKRIHDLKAVESWLQLNTNLLRTTIQGLEVQRATLVALQTFGNALSPEKMQSAMENVARAANAPSAHPAHHANPFETPRTVSEAQADAENDVPDEEEADSPPESAAETGDAAASAAASDSRNAQLPPNAALWWDLLQRQFAQIASSAAAASAAPFGGGMSGMPGMPGMPGFGGMAAGADGAEPASQAPSTAAPKPTARKATAKKPAAKKPAAKAPKKAAAPKTAPDDAK